MRSTPRPAAALALLAWASAACAGGFDVAVLGARGGLEDGNLSAYLVQPIGDDRAVLCDAGTVLGGLEAAQRQGALDHIAMPQAAGLTRPGYVARTIVRGYLISHAHLDHIAGLVAIAPDDAAKPIYALRSVNDTLARNVFNWAVWPNAGDRGTPPLLRQYHYQDLVAGQGVPVQGTALTITAFPLSHGSVVSTAFLIEGGRDAMLYLGDTGADAIEKSTHLHDVWQAVAPLIRARRLRGIIIECSYDDARPDRLLFGHLTPRWLTRELGDLQTVVGVSLRGLPVLVAHMKPSLRAGPRPETVIMSELAAHDTTGVRFIPAEQGLRLLWK
jgi:3',5'-cyclic-nucleotide phosphodiesterase